MTTLTIRIDADLKEEVLSLARETGEDASTWIRRFFERIRNAGGDSASSKWTGDDDGAFSAEFIESIRSAKKGSFRKFNVGDYV